MQKIIILDFGSQTTQLIGRRVRELDTFCEIMPYNKYPEDDPKFDSLGGFIMIKAPKLEYSAIMKALENGDFYASSGPEIYEMWTEGEDLHIKTSPVAKISVTRNYGENH